MPMALLQASKSTVSADSHVQLGCGSSFACCVGYVQVATIMCRGMSMNAEMNACPLPTVILMLFLCILPVFVIWQACPLHLIQNILTAVQRTFRLDKELFYQVSVSF